MDQSILRFLAEANLDTEWLKLLFQSDPNGQDGQVQYQICAHIFPQILSIFSPSSGLSLNIYIPNMQVLDLRLLDQASSATRAKSGCFFLRDESIYLLCSVQQGQDALLKVYELISKHELYQMMQRPKKNQIQARSDVLSDTGFTDLERDLDAHLSELNFGESIMG